MLYTLNLYSALYQLCLNKSERENHHPIIFTEFHRYNKKLPFKSWQQMESVKKQKNKDPQ